MRRMQSSSVRLRLWVIFAGMLACLQLVGGLPAQAADLSGKTVTAVEVAGQSQISDSTVMAVIKTVPGDKLEADRIKKDMQAIYDLGYFYDVTANFTEVPEGVKVLFKVVENPRLTGIVVKGATKVPEAKIKSMVTTKPGAILNSRTLSTNSRAIEEYYHEQGYILTKVSDVNMSPQGVLTLTINEGMLEGIKVSGNEKTKTKVITREMNLKTGEVFDSKKAKRAMQNVYNLGYFEDVDMKLNPGKEPNAVVMEAKVTEQKTGSFAVGGGYNGNDGFVGIFEVADNNFRGTGDKAKFHWEFGGVSKKNYEISYTKPWLDDKHTSLGITFYSMTNQITDYYNGGDERSTYDRKRVGIEMVVSRPAGEFIRNYVGLKVRRDEYVEYVSGPEDYANDPQYLQDNFGTTRSLMLSRVFDSRDNVYNPTKGKRYAITAEIAGFGGDFKFNKFTLEGRQYIKVGRTQVLATRLTAGYATGSMPESQQFTVGGTETLRGYEDEEYKGTKLFSASVEYRFPMMSKMDGVLFTDVGKAWSDGGYSLSGLKHSVGAGIRFNSPLGPIKLDYGKGDEGGRFHFSFGGQF
ncbi:MAG TPA: outer membrane protein assembly factor [Patescibacteria group bacterium]|nr:outer membrane protein assembly factor [Patescibacteria group bacterium]